MSGAAWWRGKRGEWYVAGQAALFVLVAVGPCTLCGWPIWAFPDSVLVSTAGMVLLVGGAGMVIAGAVQLRSRLTPLPYPVEEGTLLDTGVYGVVRHPMYSGGVSMAFGWALWRQGWLTLVYAALLFLFLDVKARREERWLAERFPWYADYQRRVRRLIPFVY